MGVVFRSKFIFFQTPRTASNAIKNALRAINTVNRRPVHHDWFTFGQHMARPEFNRVFPGYRNLPGICGIRNPFDILASWFVRLDKYKTIEELINKEDHENFTRNGLLFYHVPHCQYIVRYEKNMIRRIDDILNHLKCRPIERLPKIAVTKNKKPYQRYYTKADVKAVWEMFGDEITDFNYDFEGKPLG